MSAIYRLDVPRGPAGDVYVPEARVRKIEKRRKDGEREFWFYLDNGEVIIATGAVREEVVPNATGLRAGFFYDDDPVTVSIMPCPALLIGRSVDTVAAEDVEVWPLAPGENPFLITPDDRVFDIGSYCGMPLADVIREVEEMRRFRKEREAQAAKPEAKP